MMTLTDCDGNSLLPDEDPVTVREDRNAETIRACLPSDIASTGLLVEVDGGSCRLTTLCHAALPLFRTLIQYFLAFVKQGRVRSAGRL